MEEVSITLTKEKLQFLIDNNVLQEGEYGIKKVDVPDYDYSSNLQWVELSKASKKIYKELKELEFVIRNGK